MNYLKRSFVVLTIALAFVTLGKPAHSAPKDAAATKLAEDAITGDYLSTNFAEAEKKLRKALALCAVDACGAAVRARIHRDLGVVLVAGLNRAEDGKAEFAQAIKADPGITLDKDLTTPNIEKAFKAAKGGGAASTAAEAAPAAVTGDLIHTPPAEQAVLTPVPIYTELNEGVSAVRVIVRYKPFGTTDWKTLELRRVGRGFGGEIPCQDVGSTTGDLSYYIQATDAQGDVVATSGLRVSPNKVTIKSELSGEAPHLPGRPAPSQCRDAADCPPGLPGCPAAKKSGGKGWGATCDHDSECGAGLACKNGSCESGDKSGSEPAKSCEMDSDCDAGAKCNADKVCEGPGGPVKKVWLSLSVQQDIGIVSSERNVCGPRATTPNLYYCLEDNGQYLYSGTPIPSDVPGKGNAVKGGFKAATTRVLLGVDFLLGSNVSFGLRGGYAFGTSQPGEAVHGEGRLAYYFGKDPFKRKGLRPFALALGGYGYMEPKLTVPIIESPNTVNPRQGRPATQTLQTWRKTGPGFVGLGVGAMIPTGSSSGIVVEVKFEALFGNSGLALSPLVGYAIGL